MNELIKICPGCGLIHKTHEEKYCSSCLHHQIWQEPQSRIYRSIEGDLSYTQIVARLRNKLWSGEELLTIGEEPPKALFTFPEFASYFWGKATKKKKATSPKKNQKITKNPKSKVVAPKRDITLQEDKEQGSYLWTLLVFAAGCVGAFFIYQLIPQKVFYGEEPPRSFLEFLQEDFSGTQQDEPAFPHRGNLKKNVLSLREEVAPDILGEFLLDLFLLSSFCLVSVLSVMSPSLSSFFFFL